MKLSRMLHRFEHPPPFAPFAVCHSHFRFTCACFRLTLSVGAHGLHPSRSGDFPSGAGSRPFLYLTYSDGPAGQNHRTPLALRRFVAEGWGDCAPGGLGPKTRAASHAYVIGRARRQHFGVRIWAKNEGVGEVHRGAIAALWSGCDLRPSYGGGLRPCCTLIARWRTRWPSRATRLPRKALSAVALVRFRGVSPVGRGHHSPSL